MRAKQIGFVVLSKDVRSASTFYTTHFGFDALVVLDWFASHQHPDLNDLFFDLVQEDHPAAGDALRSAHTGGVLLAFLVEDCDQEFNRVQRAGLPIVMAPQNEPWGQRRCQIQAPDGVIIELIQQIPPNEEWMRVNA
jgi:uncharacterized glyoxalase superfamily protein PhnB